MENEVVWRPEGGGISPKSRLVALLLGIFLGGFGAHQFYLGRIARGVVHLVLYVLGIALYIGGFVRLVSNGEIDSESLSIGGIAAIAIGVILLLIPVIWGTVSWIIIAIGKAKDKDGLPVTKWLDDDGESRWKGPIIIKN